MHARSNQPLRESSLPRLLVFALLAASLALTGCSRQASPEELQADRDEVTAMLERYLALLSDGYATGNLEPMRELAAEKEVATVSKLVQEYAQQGVAIRPQLRELTLEDFAVWNTNNAYATTVEVWDLRKYVIGTETLLSEALAQSHRVKYQLKRRPEGWQVMYRQAKPIE